MQFSIRFKLIALFVFGIVLVAGMGLFSLHSLKTVDDVSGDLRTTWLPKIEAASAMKGLMTTHNLLARRRLQTTDRRQQAAIGASMNAAADQFERLVATYRQAITGPDEETLVGALMASWPAYLRDYAGNSRRLEAGQIGAALSDFETLTMATFDECLGRLQALAAFAEDGTDLARKRRKPLIRRRSGCFPPS